MVLSTSQAPITKSTRRVLGKLAECGWLYNKVRKYADSRSTDRAFGLVGQSFCAALHQELTEYYRLIAVLDAQVGRVPGGSLTAWNEEFTVIILIQCGAIITQSIFSQIFTKDTP